MQQAIHNIRKAVRERQPLIHCITNPISINQCANAILAVGARPMMAEHPKEVSEITQTAQALMLNLGNITDARMKSILLSAQSAREQNIPFLLDAVGIACSKLRREYVKELLNVAVPTVIKGNYSEIQALYQKSYHSSGVDADSSLDIHTIDHAAISLAVSLETIILASGKVDIVTDGYRLIHIHNGTPLLSQITGTGCLQGALCASYLSAKAAHWGHHLMPLYKTMLKHERSKIMKLKTALTIAGSDCSGGAGIQADIKTMTMNGVYAMSAVTALTAQNTTGVRAIQESTPEFLKQQIDAVFEDIYPDAVKIGMVCLYFLMRTGIKPESWTRPMMQLTVNLDLLPLFEAPV